MKIFLSHASQDKAVAEPIAFSLRSRGYKVFLDRDDLPPGVSYDQQIEGAVNDSDIFVFLISPDSVAEGRYTLTELTFARRKWPDPNRRVLPVMARKTPLEQVPPYLRAVSILEPVGNIVAEASSAVHNMQTEFQVSESSLPPSNTKELSTRDATIYGVGVAAFGAAFATGPTLYDNHPLIGGSFTLVGVVGLIVMALLLIRYRLKLIHALIGAIIALFATWAVFAYVLWTKPKEVIVHDPPTAEDIAKATAPIIAERDAAIKTSQIPNDRSAGSASNTPRLNNESKIPPDRLLSASPFGVRLEDCVSKTCDVTVYLRGYDTQGRLRYDNKQKFSALSTGHFLDTSLNTAELMYFEPSQQIAFRAYCRLGSGPLLVGDQRDLDWKARNEGTADFSAGYSVWLRCGDQSFKVGIGVGVRIATLRINEPAVKPASDQPN